MMLAALLSVALAQTTPAPDRADRVGVVSHVKVLTDRVPDVSSIDAWKASTLKDGQSDADRALAVWKTVRTFQHQDAPPNEYLQESVVMDPIKVFNVYGYGFCSMASAGVEALSRHAGLSARGRIINSHSVPEVEFAGQWRLLDSSLMCYFPKADGLPASVDEIMSGVKAWYDRNPGYKGDDAKLRRYMRGGGWRKGPEILARCPQYDDNGWFEAATHGWYSTMQEYDGSHNGFYEYGYSQGYQVNLQLRPGMRITRPWANKGLHVNMKESGPPGCLSMKVGDDSLRYTPADGDLAPGRVGNGTLEWDVPVAGPAWRASALSADNLEDGLARVKDPSKPGVLVIRVPSSYVYLAGKLTMKAAGAVAVSFSENHGLDWRPLVSADVIDLTPHVFRRYDYRLRFELKGAGAALERLRIEHDTQHSQRSLPAFGQGGNTVTFSAGPQEGTVTVEGATGGGAKGKQLQWSDFHARIQGIDPGNFFIGDTGKGELEFPVSTPGDLVRLRFGAHYRARDAKDGWDYRVSFDDGKSWKEAGRAAGPTAGNCRYVTFSDVPAGTRAARVKFSGTSRNATGILDFRIDADYREPAGGFRPVKATYRWSEDGKPKEQVFIARKPQEKWTVTCAVKPVMGSLALELE